MSSANEASENPAVTIETVRRAIMGAHISKNRELYASYGGVPQECIDAAKVIRDHYPEFQAWVRDRLATLPLMEAYLGQQIEMRMNQDGFLASPIASALVDDEKRLERRLANVHTVTALKDIIKEMGRIKDPREWDRRLLDAWAEIRVIDQLVREGFTEIKKVRYTADFVAVHTGNPYAISVTRISREPHFPDMPLGDITEVISQVEEPICSHFWNSLDRKNSKLSKDFQSGYIRRIVLVTNIYHLQDPFNRHVACQQLRNSILAIPEQNFDEVQWLLDDGNGAIFKVHLQNGEVRVRCFADWADALPVFPGRDTNAVDLHEVDLDSEFPAFVT